MKLMKRIMAMLCVILLITDICLPYGLAVYGREDYEADGMMAADSELETTELNTEEALPVDEAVQSEEPQTDAETEPTEEPQTDAETEPAAGEMAQPSENQAGETAETEQPKAESTQTMTYEDGEVKVQVTAVDPDAIPKNAALKVVPIVEKKAEKDMSKTEIAEIDAMNAQYKEVADKLAKKAEKEAYNIAGFLAYDISLVDKDGNKVEPNGEVKVSMDYKKAVIPEEAAQAVADQTGNTQTDAGQNGSAQAENAPLDVTVMHFEEDANGQVKEIVDMVADEKTEASVQTTENAEVEKTEFVTDSFSMFTITWSYGYYYNIKINIHYIDTEGTDIGPDSSLTFDKTREGELDLQTECAINFENREIERITTGTPDGIAIKKIRATKVTGSAPEMYYLKSQPEEWEKWFDFPESYGVPTVGDIYFVYSSAEIPTEEPGPAPDTPPRIKEKYVEKHDDGTYDLTLDVSGRAGTWEGKVKLNVVFVLDISGSMQYALESGDPVIASQNRLAKANQAIRNAVDNIDADADAKYSLVTFSSSYYPDEVSETRATWVSGTTLKSKLPDPSTATGATNYEAGLIDAQELIQTAPEGAATVVVFLSDGDPTTYYGDNGPGDKYNPQAMTKAQNQLKTMATAQKKMDQFYTLGVGPTSNYTKLKYLTDALKGTSVKYGNYEGMNYDALAKAFDNIIENVIDAATRVPCTNVTITDTLSDYAEIAGTTPELQIVVKQINSTADGTTLTTVAGTGWAANPSLTLRGEQLKYKLNKNNATFKDKGAKLTASYNSATRQIVLDFPDDYWLEPDYIYYVKAKIKPTEKATTDYKANVAAKRPGYAVNEETADASNYVAHQGDPNTDANSEANANATGHNTITSGATITSSGQDGFYANSEATVAYWNQQEEAGTEKRTAPYSKPVIQVTDPIEKAKYIKDNKDGTYDLTLNLQAMPEESSVTEPMDIVLVLDGSESMGSWTSGTKLTTMKDAVATMITQIDSSVDVQWEVISFNGKVTNESGGWVDAKDAEIDVGKIIPVSWLPIDMDRWGTHYKDALNTTADVLTKRNAGRKKIVVFLTDGLPEYWHGYNRELVDPFYEGVAAAPNVECDEFYAVGVDIGTTGNDYGERNGTYYGYLTPEQVLNEVTNQVNAPIAEKYTISTTQKDLPERLQGIVRSVTNNRCKNVVITDTLTDYVQLKAGTSLTITMKDSDVKNSEDNIVASATVGPLSDSDLKNGKEFNEIWLKKTDGTEVTKVNVKYEPTKFANDGSNGRITLTFPTDYVLQRGMVYDITMKIEPTKDAADRYIDNGKKYTVNGTEVKGDLGTDDVRNDTSSNKPGFHSNVVATVDYNYNGTTYTGEEYDHPVVQVQVTESKAVTVTKVWKDGHDKYGTRPNKIAFQLQYSKNGKEPWTWYTGTEGTTPIVYEIPNPDTGQETVTTDTWTSKVEGLPSGYTYKAVEIDVPEGYTAEVVPNGDNITVTNTLHLDWKIIKQSSSVDQNNDTHPQLEGAVFSLTKKAGSANPDAPDAQNTPVYYGISGPPKKTTPDEGTGSGEAATPDEGAGSGEGAGSDAGTTPSATSAPDGEIRWYASGDYQENTGLVDGAAAISLEDGIYTMQEIKAPIGYAKSNTTWELTVKDGILISVKVGGVEQLSKNAKVGNEVKFFIDNVAIYELPSAAGPGIYRYLISGMLCMIAAALVLYKNMHREEVMEK